MKRWIALALRILVGVVAPGVFFMIKYDVFATAERFSSLMIVIFGMIIYIALKGVITGTRKDVPNRYAYIYKMLQFPALLGAICGLTYGAMVFGEQLIEALLIIIVFNILSMPFTIWYNHILYQIYGEEVNKFVQEGIFDRIARLTNRREE